MDLDTIDGSESWLRALDDAADARDRLRSACLIDPASSRARLARHDLAAAFDILVAGLADNGVGA